MRIDVVNGEYLRELEGVIVMIILFMFSSCCSFCLKQEFWSLTMLITTTYVYYLAFLFVCFVFVKCLLVE